MVSRKALVVIVALVMVSPLFGVIGAEIVGYREPLEVAAEAVGLTEGEPVWEGVLPDYTVPGLPDTVGYVVAGFAGVAVLLAPAALRGRRK